MTTPKDFMIKRYPEAWCQNEGGLYRVYTSRFGLVAVQSMGEGRSAKHAWRNAASTVGMVMRGKCHYCTRTVKYTGVPTADAPIDCGNH